MYPCGVLAWSGRHGTGDGQFKRFLTALESLNNMRAGHLPRLVAPQEQLLSDPRVTTVNPED